MNTIKNHFDTIANIYDNDISNVVPYYKDMLNILVDTIPYTSEDTFSILDLGCGTGSLSSLIMNKFPKANLTCVDLAENMLEEARKKLQNYQTISYDLSDFTTYQFDKPYNVILSCLAIHHLNTDEKKAFYTKIFNALDNGGCFYNADPVKSNNPQIDKLALAQWKDYMRKSFNDEEVINKWIQGKEENDQPDHLFLQLHMLKEIGFKLIDVVWMYANNAIFGGIKE